MRVLVTRPEPGASRTARRLAEAGHQPLLLPLSRIEPLPAQLDALPDAVAATSANALHNTPAELVEKLRDLPVFAVGDATAAAAAAAGFHDVRSAAGDAAALARLVRSHTPPVSRLAWLCGRRRKPGFDEAMLAAGIAVEIVATYDVVDVELDQALVEAVLGKAPPDTALVYSPNGARALRRLAARDEQLARTPSILCISADAALPLEGLFGSVTIAETPDEDAMFDRLARLKERAEPGRV
ncbi:MAG: uroporphyrinogen-III synthase [Rhizobiaceae bacterium]|nr:uroporphyrinogen-III synthase [Rhizobiaceae bacterium]MCV0407629.1 uroporphyrinogen-III synthase [Rhizobiaceae bacterium]